MLTETERKLIISQFDKEEVVHLAEVAGRVTTVRDFAERHKDVLRPFECATVRDNMELLSNERLDDVTSPLAIQRGETRGSTKALRSGSRSAMIAQASLYLKACRPRPDRPDLFFPSVDVNVETGVIEEKRVPFGVLTAEGVMREILGFLVHRRNAWDFARTPVGVFEYEDAGPTPGYAIAFSLEPGFCRIETMLPRVEASLEDLLAAECVRTVSGLDFAPGEWTPAGIPMELYAEMKALRLATLHANGYFRGFLNSNIGNDLLAFKDGMLRLALIDLDTFQALDVERLLQERTGERIVEFGCVEAMKSLLPVFDFVITDLSDGGAAFEAVEFRLRERITLLGIYESALRASLRGQGWPDGVIDAGFARAKVSTLYRNCVLDLVPNSFLLSTSYKSALSLYAEQLH
jgi:hypothetical protein